MEIIDTLKKTGDAVERLFSTDTNMDMDILKKLHQEHEEVKALLKQLVDSESISARKSTLKKLKAALVPHERAEEKVVYDALIAQNDNDTKIDGEEGFVEHDLADKTLAKLKKIDDEMSPEFTAAAKVLKEVLEHHIDEEERNVWKDVRDHFDRDERLEMNRKFESEKKKVRVS